MDQIAQGKSVKSAMIKDRNLKKHHLLVVGGRQLKGNMRDREPIVCGFKTKSRAFKKGIVK